MKQTHTNGPWIVQADPLLAKRHPLHENRYVTTDHQMETWRSRDAEGNGDDCAGFDGPGVIICTMPDSEHQKANARLISAAPELLDTCKRLLAVIEDFMPNMRHSVVQNYAELNDAQIAARKAIAKATIA